MQDNFEDRAEQLSQDEGMSEVAALDEHKGVINAGLSEEIFSEEESHKTSAYKKSLLREERDEADLPPAKRTKLNSGEDSSSERGASSDDFASESNDSGADCLEWYEEEELPKIRKALSTAIATENSDIFITTLNEALKEGVPDLIRELCEELLEDAYKKRSETKRKNSLEIIKIIIEKSDKYEVLSFLEKQKRNDDEELFMTVFKLLEPNYAKENFSNKETLEVIIRKLRKPSLIIFLDKLLAKIKNQELILYIFEKLYEKLQATDVVYKWIRNSKVSSATRNNFFHSTAIDEDTFYDAIRNNDLFSLKLFKLGGCDVVEDERFAYHSDEEVKDELLLNVAVENFLTVEQEGIETAENIIYFLLRNGADPRARDFIKDNALDKLSCNHELDPERVKKVKLRLRRYKRIHQTKDFIVQCEDSEYKKQAENFCQQAIACATNAERYKQLKDQIRVYLKNIEVQLSISYSLLENYLKLRGLIEDRNISVEKAIKETTGYVVDLEIMTNRNFSCWISSRCPGRVCVYPLPAFADSESQFFALISTLSYLDTRESKNPKKSARYMATLELVKKLDPDEKNIKEILAEYIQEQDELLKKLRDEHQVKHRKRNNKEIENLEAEIRSLRTPFSIKRLNKALELKERQDDYCSEYPSDDSDDEEEQKFQNPAITTSMQKMLLKSAARRLIDKAGANEVVSKKNGELRILKVLAISPRFGDDVYQPDAIVKLTQLPSADHKSDMIEQDLRRLNFLWMSGQLNEESIKQLETKFVVAHYRGINYNIDQWGQKARRAHRAADEIGKPLYSLSVFATAQCTPIKLIEARKKGDFPDIENILYALAIKLHDQLVTLRHSGPVVLGKHSYNDAGVAVQDQYSKDINGFHKRVSEKLKQLKSRGVVNPEDLIFTAFFNERNAFVSTGGTPQHALWYAYGTKFYEGYKHQRLRPCYNMKGRPEHPYSGKVYVTLHEPLDLLPNIGPMHVPSLNETGKTYISKMVDSELETTFPGFIDKDKVVAQHVAKFPSFESEKYKEIYLYKYGLTKELYDLFRKGIKDTKPHTQERAIIQNLLTTYLCAYQGVSLIEQAYNIAKEKNQVLVYRDEFGNFSFLPPQIRFNSDKESGKKVYANHKANKEKYKQLDANMGFFSKLVNKKQPLNSFEDDNEQISSLLKSVIEQKLDENLTNLELSDEDVKHIQMLSGKYHAKDIIYDYIEGFYRASRCLGRRIVLHNPSFSDEKLAIQDIENTENLEEIHFYYGGGQSFHLLPQFSAVFA